MATAKVGKEAEWQNRLVSEAEKSTNNALHAVVSLGGRIVVAGTREVESFSNLSVASSRV